MASTSSSSSSALVAYPRRNYYDVFVSFRGKDTRYNFTDHLFAALQRKGIFAFRDETNLKKGESIAPELLRAIEDSHIFVVVFSKNYASSTWCLRELECIFQFFQLSGKHVLPIFYDVDPSEVRYQNGSYAEAFSKHEQRFQRDPEMIQRWRASLTEVANLSGWDIRDKPQSAEIEKISKEIINILHHKFSSLPKDLVGMDSPIEELEKHLLLDSDDDVRVVGICGMGGIGKTTLATVLYSKISHQFPVYCLIDDLSKIYRHDGPISAQKQILRQTLGKEHLNICNVYNASNLIRSRLHRVKSLIILDNVDQVEQLEKLDVSREWLGAGSRIVIISRDEHILKEYQVDVVYKVRHLNLTDSLLLFSRKAFKLDHVMSNYEKLAFEILSYANGLPLAIKVLGSLLCGRNIVEWKSALARLRESPNKDISDVLRLSFDRLEEMENEIFLHFACFFHYPEEKYVKNVLNCCGFHADIGLRVLLDKSLISILGIDSIKMHSLLRELGRKIIQESSSKESRKWSRVWLQEQFYNVMLNNMEKKVEAICFVRDEKEPEPEPDILIIAETLSKMCNLRLLILSGVIFSGKLSCLSNELRYMEWDRYPFKYLPSSFQPNHLVELILRHSSIKKLCKHKMYFPNLRTLDMSHSKNLRKVPDCREIQNLEQLNLEGCEKLVQIDPSVGVLRKLVILNLKDCKNLANIPNNIFGSSILKCLNLSGCPKVFKNPRQLMKIDSRERSSHSQPATSSILIWTKFRYHSLDPKDLASCLLHSLLNLSCLRKLDISFSSLSHLPDAIGLLCWLEELNLGGNNFVTLPSLRELSKLVYLNLEHCKLLESLPHLPFPTTTEHNTYGKTKGLVIFNCPKLGERERYSSMIFSWMIQFIQVNSHSSTLSFDDIIYMVIPKSEIPIWSYNQREGDSISFIMHENVNDFIGIACCVVFSVAPTTTAYAKRPKMDLCIINFTTRIGSYQTVPIILEKDLITVKSDHMCIIYFPLELFLFILKSTDATVSHLDHFNMTVVIKNREGMDLEVQSCGYHLVCKQDQASLLKFKAQPQSFS